MTTTDNHRALLEELNAIERLAALPNKQAAAAACHSAEATTAQRCPTPTPLSTVPASHLTALSQVRRG